MHKEKLTDNYSDEPARYARQPELQLPARILHWAERDPDRPFLTEVGGSRSDGCQVSYGQFARELRQWCTLLQELGLERGDYIASLLPPSIDGCLVWLAAGVLGIREVPVNRELRGEFLRHPIVNSRCKLCFMRPDDASLLQDNAIIGPRQLIVEPGNSPAAQLAETVLPALPACDDVACVVYTSGSTGPAKGAIIRWAQLAAIIGRAPREWLSSDDVVYAPWPMFHITGRSPLISMADVGGQVVLREKFSLTEFWSDVRQYQCTSTTVGAAVPLLLNLPPRPDDADNPLQFAYGNASGAHNLTFQQRFGVRMLLCYGSTEAGFPVVHRDITEHSLGIVGHLRPGYEFRVVDAEGRELPPGQPGELLIRPQLPEMIMAGYLNMPEATATALRDGWYHTGDLLSVGKDGACVFVDRMKDTIRRYGENISASAYESDLLQLDVLIECAVLGIASQISGKEIILTARHSAGSQADPAAFFAQLEQRYPRYMLPGYIWFVDDYPKTPGGKIRKHLLLEQLQLDNCWQTPAADANRGNA
jgi:carnitine-CoA ligase